LINIFTNITSNSPNVEGLTSISAWVITCILFVFGALIGYAGLLIKKKILVKVTFRLLHLKLALLQKFFLKTYQEPQTNHFRAIQYFFKRVTAEKIKLLLTPITLLITFISMWSLTFYYREIT
jgi:hypothetical protein